MFHQHPSQQPKKQIIVGNPVNTQNSTVIVTNPVNTQTTVVVSNQKSTPNIPPYNPNRLYQQPLPNQYLHSNTHGHNQGQNHSHNSHGHK